MNVPQRRGKRKKKRNEEMKNLNYSVLFRYVYICIYDYVCIRKLICIHMHELTIAGIYIRTRRGYLKSLKVLLPYTVAFIFIFIHYLILLLWDIWKVTFPFSQEMSVSNCERLWSVFLFTYEFKIQNIIKSKKFVHLTNVKVKKRSSSYEF